MFRWLIGLTVSLALLLLPTLTTQAQGDDVNALIDAAITFLGNQLGTTLTRADISRWTWEETIWPDASMGCPQPDQMYAQVVTRGYNIRLQYGGIIYEVHITSDGQTAILCGSEAAPSPTPRPPAATLPPQREDPEALIEMGIAYLNAQLNLGLTRNQLARWTWQEAVWQDTSLGCPQPDQEYDDDAPVRGYIVTLEHAGTVYELHISADGNIIMPCNDERLTPMIGGILLPEPTPMIASTPLPLAPQTTPAALPEEALIYTGPDGNVYLGSVGDFPGQPLTSDARNTAAPTTIVPTYSPAYGDYRWSPDGSLVAFIDQSHPYRLLLTDGSGAPPRVLAEGLTPLYPPAWSPDGSEIAYISPTQTFRANSQVMTIYAIEPPTNGAVPEPRQIGTFEQMVGCGGGSADPADWVYSRETGFMGNRLVFTWLPGDNFLFSNSCTGVGLAHLEAATGETTVIAPDLARASLSPDLRQVAGIAIAQDQTRQLVIVDLQSGERATFPLEFTPDQVLWSVDGQRLYVSTVDQEETLALADGTGTATVYAVRLWQVDLTTGESALSFEQEGRGIGRMSETPDGSGLVFAFVESARGWVEAVESGADMAAQQEAAPASWLLFLNEQGRIVRLGRGGHPALRPSPPMAG